MSADLKTFCNQLGKLASTGTQGGIRRLCHDAETFMSGKGGLDVSNVEDELAKFIIEAFHENMAEDNKKRAENPNGCFGPSLRQQFDEARFDPEYRKVFQDVRNNLKNKLKLTTRQLRVISFVRNDRLHMNRLEREAEEDGQVLTEGFSFCSPANLLKADIEPVRELYKDAARLKLMVQAKNGEGPAQWRLMRKRADAA